MSRPAELEIRCGSCIRSIPICISRALTSGSNCSSMSAIHWRPSETSTRRLARPSHLSSVRCSSASRPPVTASSRNGRLGTTESTWSSRAPGNAWRLSATATATTQWRSWPRTWHVRPYLNDSAGCLSGFEVPPSTATLTWRWGRS